MSSDRPSTKDITEIQTLLTMVRMKSGLTQEDVAKKLGVSRQTITDFEKGRKPAKPWLLMAIASLLLVSAGGFLALTVGIRSTDDLKAFINKLTGQKED